MLESYLPCLTYVRENDSCQTVTITRIISFFEAVNKEHILHLSDIDNVIVQGYPQTSDIFVHIICLHINYGGPL